MFIYQNNNKDICINFENNRPNLLPDYSLSVRDNKLFINGIEIPELTKNIVEADYQVPTGGEVINSAVGIYLNNKTISAIDDTAGDGVFHVVAGGSLTIDGNGCINGVGNNNYNMAIWADGGNVTINNGKFTNIGATADTDPTHFDLIYAKNGSVVEINGGYFECETPKWTLNSHDTNKGTFIVKGGTFYKYDPSNAETEPGGIVNFVAPGYKVIKDGNLYTVVKN